MGIKFYFSDKFPEQGKVVTVPCCKLRKLKDSEIKKGINFFYSFFLSTG